MCNYCNIKPGEEFFGYSLAPSLCWVKTERLQNNRLEIVFGYGEDSHDRLILPVDYCPFCGEKQNLTVWRSGNASDC